MKISLKTKLAYYLAARYPDKVKKIVLEDWIRENGASVDAGASRLRELEREGIISKDYEDGFVRYQFLMTDWNRQRYGKMTDEEVLRYSMM